MTVLPIVRLGDPVLRRRAAEVLMDEIATPAIQNLIDGMIATMRAAPGVGLAAPQVGEARRIIVVEDPPEAVERLTDTQRADRRRLAAFPLQVFINPRLRTMDGSARVVFPEGCLSIPFYAGLVERDVDVEIAFHDRDAVFHDWTPLSGWPARIAQHEVDHLDGILYTDRMVARSFMTDDIMRRRCETTPIDALVEELRLRG